MDEQSGESKEEEVIGEGIGESEMEELGPEWGWRETERVDSRDMVKHNAMRYTVLCRIQASSKEGYFPLELWSELWT